MEIQPGMKLVGFFEIVRPLKELEMWKGVEISNLRKNKYLAKLVGDKDENAHLFCFDDDKQTKAAFDLALEMSEKFAALTLAR